MLCIQISTTCHQLTNLILDQCTKLTDAGISAVVKSCSRLEKLSLDECTQVPYLIEFKNGFFTSWC